MDKLISCTKRFFGSVWLFPSFIMFVFILFVILGINGSSVGIQQPTFYGNMHDKNLIAGEPRNVRSDEWLVMTQMVAGQKEANYPVINKNIGDGQNMNLILDVPSHDWSQVLRPQNHLFSIAPFENAFAYRWWFSAVVLLLSVYFLALHFLPKRRLLASLIALSLYFAAFVQWWYISATLGSLGYSILLILLFVKFIHAKRIWQKATFSLLMAYVALCFMIILYPPFQVACLLATVAFIVGYVLYSQKTLLTFLKKSSLYLAPALLIVLSVTALFLYQNRSTVTILQNTSYPGKRLVSSGGHSVSQFLSGPLAVQHLSQSKSQHYKQAANQSESSSFLFLGLFLFPALASLVLIKKKIDIRSIKTLSLCLGVCSLLFLGWLFIPGLNILGHLTKLDIVPPVRLIIGFGLLNTLVLIVFLFTYAKSRYVFRLPYIVVYSTLFLIMQVVVNLYIHHSSPEFVSLGKAVLLALPIPIAIYFILRKQFVVGIAIYAVFTIIGGAPVNPLYRGLDIITENPLVKKIETYPRDGSRWIAEDGDLENIAITAGYPSMSGVFFYPQNNLWRKVDEKVSVAFYNRFAHVRYIIDRSNKQNPTAFIPTVGDPLVIRTDPCSKFIQDSNIRHIITSSPINLNDSPCVTDLKSVNTPGKKFYIYSLTFYPLKA